MSFEWKNLPEIRTRRLLLRKLVLEDRDDLFEIYGDHEVMKFTDDDCFANCETVVEMLESVEKLFRAKASIEWGVEDLSSRKIIGTCGLHSFSSDCCAGEAGCLLARQFWGKGIMREAMVGVIGFARDSLGLKRLRADIEPENVRSIKLFTNLGFKPAKDGILELEL